MPKGKRKTSDKLTNRQRTTLHALKKLKDTDMRGDSPWLGAFGAGAIALITGSTKRKVENDLDILKDGGYIEPETNLLFRITESGERELENGTGGI